MSLFKEGVMRKPDKAALHSLILLMESEVPREHVKVVDGGALLHQVMWPSGVIFGELLSHHVRTVRSRYGSCHIVFDVYDTPSIKDHEHTRRNSNHNSKEILFSNVMKVNSKRENFLANNKNKSYFIAKLKPLLVEDMQKVTKSESDADTDIISVALKVIMLKHAS